MDNFFFEILAAIICVFFIPNLWVAYTQYIAVKYRVSAQAVDRFCRELKFPFNVVYAISTRGNPSEYLRIAAVGGTSCQVVFSFAITYFMMFTLIPLSILLNLYSPKTMFTVGRLLTDLLIIIGVILVSMFAYRFSYRLKLIEDDEVKKYLYINQ